MESAFRCSFGKVRRGVRLDWEHKAAILAYSLQSSPITNIADTVHSGVHKHRVVERHHRRQVKIERQRNESKSQRADGTNT